MERISACRRRSGGWLSLWSRRPVSTAHGMSGCRRSSSRARKSSPESGNTACRWPRHAWSLTRNGARGCWETRPRTAERKAGLCRRLESGDQARPDNEEELIESFYH